MNRRITLQILLALILIFTITGISQAQNCDGSGGPKGGNNGGEIQPDCPPDSGDPQIIGASFADGWWDIVSTPNTNSFTDANGFTSFSDANFLVNNRIVTDVNPSSPYSSYCPVTQIATVLKYHSRELVQRTQNDWDWGGMPMYSTTAGYEINPSLMVEPFDLIAETRYGCSVPPAPMQPPAPIEPEIINVGGLGVSLLRYDYERSIDAYNYIYTHMRISS